MRRFIAILVSLITSLAVALPSAAAPRSAEWQDYTHPRLQFSISYPSDVFVPDPRANLDNGLALLSADGTARLLIGAFDNEHETSLEEYRTLVLDRSYKDAKLDYTPVRKSWFVLSGERDGWMFYERVSFSCEGRRITSWAMVYPVAERRYYDRLVERIAPTFRPSEGAAAGC